MRTAGVIGQLTLPLFVLDFLARDIGKAVWVIFGVSIKWRFLIASILFSSVAADLVRKTFRLYYGSTMAATAVPTGLAGHKGLVRWRAGARAPGALSHHPPAAPALPMALAACLALLLERPGTRRRAAPRGLDRCRRLVALLLWQEK